MKFLFDLDGTITSEEILPIIAALGNVQDEIDNLTNQTVHGDVPFIESFIHRVNILGNIPVSLINERLEQVNLHKHIHEFIQAHREDCIVVTGNLSCWCQSLFKKIGCQTYSSEAQVENDKVIKINSILRKEQIVAQFQALGEIVVFVGDGNNDLEAMRQANISIAAGLTHSPARSLYSICDYMIFNEEALCRQLNQLL